MIRTSCISGLHSLLTSALHLLQLVLAAGCVAAISLLTPSIDAHITLGQSLFVNLIILHSLVCLAFSVECVLTKVKQGIFSIHKPANQHTHNEQTHAVLPTSGRQMCTTAWSLTPPKLEVSKLLQPTELGCSVNLGLVQN